MITSQQKVKKKKNFCEKTKESNVYCFYGFHVFILSIHNFLQREKVEMLNWKRQDTDLQEDKGMDNPAFNHMEMHNTEKNEKMNGVNP